MGEGKEDGMHGQMSFFLSLDIEGSKDYWIMWKEEVSWIN